MNSRAVTKLLAKAIVFLVIALVSWERTPLSRIYHAGVAACAQALYGSGDQARLIDGIRASDDEFMARVLVSDKRETLHIAAGDMTGNLCVLLALYLASPIRPLVRTYFLSLNAALVALFGVHVIALYVLIRTAVAGRTAAENVGPANLVADMGPWMYPLAVLLWAPYLLTYYQATKRSQKGLVRAPSTPVARRLS